jgi:pectin methylesterase-like acyl-CoA thioesterase
MKMKYLIGLFVILTLFNMTIGQCAADRWRPPVKCQTIVALDGSGDFTSIQAAIDAAPSNSEVT